MKIMRFVLLLTIVTFATTTFATTTFAGDHPPRKSVDIKISLQGALNHKALAS